MRSSATSHERVMGKSKKKKKGCMGMRCALNARGVLEGVKLRNAHNRMVKWFSRFEGKEERESITRTA